MEIVRNIYLEHAEDGHIIVGPDADGLNLPEILWKEPDGKIVAQMTFSPIVANLVAKALLDVSNELAEKA